MAECPRFQGQVPTLDGEDEGFGLDSYAGVRLIILYIFCSTSAQSDPFSMADGLGMSPEEWQELRKQVDDSFWVMRVIGTPFVERPQLGRYSARPRLSTFTK